jgi:hypothetical protein
LTVFVELEAGNFAFYSPEYRKNSLRSRAAHDRRAHSPDKPSTGEYPTSVRTRFAISQKMMKPGSSLRSKGRTQRYDPTAFVAPS